MRARRIALALWIAWAVIVWNVVFDQIIVVAGRMYLHAAATAARSAGSYVRMDDWMRPAAIRGLWTATAAGTVVLLIGLFAVRWAARRTHSSHESAPESPVLP